jgi:OOP family OmpA-OmpF porin
MRITLSLLLLSGMLIGLPQALSQNDPSKAKLIINFTDPEKNPLKNRMLVVKNLESGKEYKGKTNAKGKLVIKVPSGNKYQVVYKSVKGPEKFSPIKIPDRNNLTFTFNAQFEKRQNRTYTLRDVYFNTDKATLRERSYDALDDLLAAMRTNPDMKVEIAGHTDDRGSKSYNKDLSQRRAEAVKEYLLEKGIREKRVRAKGYGETKPVASNDTQQGRQKNRRVEVRILKQ